MERSRWTLTSLGQVCPWLGTHSPSGIWRILDRLDIHWKRARSYVHSPDPDYEAKLAAVENCLDLARAADGTVVTLYQDEVTIERQPTLAAAYALAGPEQPLARRSHRANTLTRLTATLDPLNGRVVPRRCHRVTVAELVAFYQQLVAAYPQARAIERWGHLHLPTYASWTNPIEKLWRKLKQDLLHLHRLADDLAGLRAAVDVFLAQFTDGSPDLLRYAGLLKED